MKPGTWARSLLSPRGRFLPGLGARLATHPRLAVFVLVTLRRLPRGRVRTAVYRNVGRPLVTRMGSLEVPVSGGSRMLVDPSDLIGRVLAISGVWEPHVTAAFYELLSPGDVCVDVGGMRGTSRFWLRGSLAAKVTSTPSSPRRKATPRFAGTSN